MATPRETARQRLYGDAPKPSATARPVLSVPRAAAGKKLYGSGYGAALGSYYDRRRASLKDDAEALAQSRIEERQTEAFARARGITPNELQEVLCVVLEHDQFAKTPEVIEQRWGQAFEALRLKHGGREPAQKLLNNYVALTAELTKEVPTLADRAGRSGAANDIRVIEALAHHGASAPPKPE